MGYACEACGETFDTLAGLRLHSCENTPVAAPDPQADYPSIDKKAAARRRESRDRNRRQRARRVTGAGLDEALESAASSDGDSALTALAHLEQALLAAMDRDDDGDAYRDIYWGYFEPLTTALDAVAREEGWSFLLDLTAAYDPRDEGEMPVVGGPVTNVVARGVVRTRLTDDVAAVPPAALEYLAAVPQVGEEYEEIGWEESMHYGWGVGHPDHDVAGTIIDVLDVDEIWASAAAIRALYADQHAAVDLYADVLRGMPAEDRVLALDDLAHIQDDDHDRWFPEYWDVETEFDREFEFAFDDAVERRLQRAVEDLGLVDDLSDDWSFADLEVEWGPEDVLW